MKNSFVLILILFLFSLPSSVLGETTCTTSVSGFNGSNIQSAINSALSGQTVCLPAGTYNLSGPVTLKSGVNIHSDKGAIVKGGSFNGSSLGNVTISGLTFDASHIFLNNTSSNIVITGNRFQNQTNTGSSLLGAAAISVNTPKNYLSTNITISNNSFYNIFYMGAVNWNGGNAISTWNINNLQITNNTFDFINQAIGVYCNHAGGGAGVSGITISGNTITRNYRYNIEVPINGGVTASDYCGTGGAANVTISGNTIKNLLTKSDGSPYNGQAGISLAAPGLGHKILNNLLWGPNNGFPKNQSDAIESMGKQMLIQGNYAGNWGTAQLIGWSDSAWTTKNNVWCGMTDPSGKKIIYLEEGGYNPLVNTGNTYYDLCSSASAVPSGVGASGNVTPPVVVTPPVLPSVPNAVSNLSAQAVSATLVKLTWTDCGNETGYILKRRPTGSSDPAFYAVGSVLPAQTTSFIDSGLTNGWSYDYQIIATNSAGSAAPSNKATIWLQPQTTVPAADTKAPSVPYGLSALATSATQINLSWAASTDEIGVTGYKIYRDGIQIGNVSARIYSDTGLTTSSVHSYTVAAYDAAGNTSGESPATFAITQISSVEYRRVGSRVSTTAALNVRWIASITGDKLGTQTAGSLGSVVGGPISANGRIWWKINYDSGVDGWSVGDYLATINTSLPAVGTVPLTHTLSVGWARN